MADQLNNMDRRGPTKAGLVGAEGTLWACTDDQITVPQTGTARTATTDVFGHCKVFEPPVA